MYNYFMIYNTVQGAVIAITEDNSLWAFKTEDEINYVITNMYNTTPIGYIGLKPFAIKLDVLLTPKQVINLLQGSDNDRVIPLKLRNDGITAYGIRVDLDICKQYLIEDKSNGQTSIN